MDYNCFSEPVTVFHGRRLPIEDISRGTYVKVHGRKAVVIITVQEYEKLSSPRQGLKEFFLSAPRVDLDITRSADTGREVEL